MGEKYNVIYDKAGKVIGTKRVMPGIAAPIRKLQRPGTVPARVVPEQMRQPLTPKIPGQNRAQLVAEYCLKNNISNHAAVFREVQRAYANSGKSVGYIENAFNRCLQYMRGEIK